MTQNTTVTCLEGVWKELSDGAVTNITFMITGPDNAIVYVQGTAGAPSLTNGVVEGIIYSAGQGERNVALTDLFPGVASVDRISALSIGGNAQVFVSNA